MTKRRIFSILLIALFLIDHFPNQTVAMNVLPSPSNTQGYVNNLIDSYNALVDSSYASNSNFDSVKRNFTLYHAIGNTFKVIVMQSAVNISGFVTLIFIPIGGNQPTIIMDPNDTFGQLFGISAAAENVTFEHLTFEFSNTITYVSLAYGIRSTDITGDYLTNSTKAAKWLYRNDASTISLPTPNQPQSNPILDFLGTFWGRVIEIISVVSGVISIYQFVWKKKPQRSGSRRQPIRARLFVVSPTVA